jgi:hypothetical protein
LPAARYWQGNGPEWDVVARSINNDTPLLGEVKWHEGEVTATDVEHAHSSLVRKGSPLSRAASSVCHVLFVPVCSQSLKHKKKPLIIIDAADVLEALRL